MTVIRREVEIDRLYRYEGRKVKAFSVDFLPPIVNDDDIANEDHDDNYVNLRLSLSESEHAALDPAKRYVLTIEEVMP